VNQLQREESREIRWGLAHFQRIPQQFLPSPGFINTGFQLLIPELSPELSIITYLFRNIYHHIFLPNVLPNLSYDLCEVIYPLFPNPFTKLFPNLATTLFPDILPTYLPTTILRQRQHYFDQE
jgi:hypothetical protein